MTIGTCFCTSPDKMTDWYFGHDSSDQCFDRLPSPDAWFQCESGGFGRNSGLANSFNSGDLMGKNYPSSQQTCQADGVHSQESCVTGGSYEDSESLRNMAGCVRPDYYFNDLTGNDSTDDIFLSPLLQDDALPFHTLNIAVPSNSNSTSMNFDSITCDTDAVAHGFASNLSSNNSDNSSSPSLKFINSRLFFEVSETKDMVFYDQDPLRGTSENNDFSFHQESVLMRLEAVLNQLDDTTRLCLRDSMYRLAKHSEQETSNNDVVKGQPLFELSLPETSAGCSRSRVTDTNESATNAIDRAVACLMFSKADTDEQDHRPLLSPELAIDGNLYNTFKTCDEFVQCEVPLFSQQTQGLSCQLGLLQTNAY